MKLFEQERMKKLAGITEDYHSQWGGYKFGRVMSRIEEFDMLDRVADVILRGKQDEQTMRMLADLGAARFDGRGIRLTPIGERIKQYLEENPAGHDF